MIKYHCQAEFKFHTEKKITRCLCFLQCFVQRSKRQCSFIVSLGLASSNSCPRFSCVNLTYQDYDNGDFVRLAPTDYLGIKACNDVVHKTRVEPVWIQHAGQFIYIGGTFSHPLDNCDDTDTDDGCVWNEPNLMSAYSRLGQAGRRCDWQG